MASGRDMSSSVLGSSDVIYDFSCTSCSEDGKNTEAVTFCVNCQTYFCESCVGLHNKLLKSHNLLDRAAMKAGSQSQSKTVTILPTDDCADHPGNVIQMYCGEHDVVCCTVCIAVDHRSCKGVDFIPKVSKGILKSQEKHGTKTSLDTVYKDLQQLKFKKAKELSELNNTRDGILKDIQGFKARILSRVNELEGKATANVQAKCQEIADHINSEIKLIDELLKATADQIETVDKTKGDNEAQLFVGIKHSQHVKTKGEHLIEELKGVECRVISFEFDKQFESVVKGIESFGTVSDNTKRPYTATLIGAYNCKASDDIHECLVFDSCVLDSGHVLITDYNNQRLKRLDLTYKLIDTCSIPRPFGVCKTGHNSAAVSSWDGKKVYLVTIGNNMVVNRSFSVCESCKGIIHHKGELFVACGTSVKVYDLFGTLLRTFQYKSNVLTHISMDYDGSEIFVADKYNGLVILNRTGEKRIAFSDPRLKNAFGVCYSACGYLLVCGKDSNNIFQLDKDGDMTAELLTNTDGIKAPVSVTFANAPKRLIVTFWPSDTIKVFRLS